ncbi:MULTISPECIES: LPD7 domain-containing protein [unclassified Serratia (in: enterobacteria)]|uniref:LPD7 domain-containing protein n=1 Tax=unclassified Serratia (in: enterobacteria) TaxID=2647522 RepID=UPI00307670E7
MQKRTYLTITPDDKKDALRAAGRLPDGSYPLEYDRTQKLWFAKSEADLETIKPWLPENTVTGNMQTVANNMTPVEEFAQVLKEAGFILPDNGLPEMDGKRHRVATEGDKAGSKSGVYQGYLDGRPAGWYQDHRASEGKVNWTSTGTYQNDPANAIKLRALTAQKRWDRDLQSQNDYARIAKTLASQWSKMPPAPDSHPYLSRKDVSATVGVRLDKYDNLVIPLSNSAGELRTLQYIKPDGTKNLKKDAEKTGNFFVVGGELSPLSPILYAEGYATAASLHQATGLPVVMTVDAGNMVTVSRNLNTLYPDTAHIILGEDDFTKADNKGLNKAREAASAINGTYVIPQFTDSERAQAFAGTASFSDFNDIHHSRGLDAVRDQLAPVLDPLLPDWRQTFAEEHPMPETHTPQDDPAEQRPGPADLAEYAAYLQDVPVAPYPGGEHHSPQNSNGVPEGMSVSEPIENMPESSDTQTPPVYTESTPEIAGSLPPQAEITAAEATPPSVETGPVSEMTSHETDVLAGTVTNEPLSQPDTAPTPPEASSPRSEEEAALAADTSQPAGTTPLPRDITELDPPISQVKHGPQTPEETAPTDTADSAAAEENGLTFTFGRQAGDVSPPEPTVSPINLDELLQGLTSRQEDRTWIYALDGQDAFRDYGDRIVMASPEASENDRMILAALLSAKANQRGAVEITGSDGFIQRTMTLIADHNIDVHLKNPQQRAQFEALLQTKAERAKPQNGLDIGPAQPGPGQTAPDSPATTSEMKPAPMAATPDAQAPLPSTSTVSQSSPAAPAQATAPELTLLEKETLRTGLTGKLLDAGKAPYQFDENNTNSFYLQLRTKTGNKTFWGVELEQALSDSGKQPGDMVKLQYLGKKAVTVNVPVKDKDGNVTGFERLDTHRNHWTVTPAMDNRLLVADKKALAPAELSTYDGNAFWTLQQKTVQAADLPLVLPDIHGHGLLYTGPDGKGQPAPETPPRDAPIPPHSKAAGSVVMHALAADGEVLAHLVKGHGDYLQGIIRHEGELQHVLARICTPSQGNTYLALNTVKDDGSLRLIGHASAVNTVKNGTANYDTFAFQMKGKDAPKFAVPLVSPEKIPPALHNKLGFSQAYTPPKAEDTGQAPRAQAKPAIQPQPQ